MKSVLKGLTFAVLAVGFGLSMVPNAMAYDPLMQAKIGAGVQSAGAVDLLTQPAVFDNSGTVLTQPAVIDNSVLTEPALLGGSCGSCNTLVQPAVIDNGCNSCGGLYGGGFYGGGYGYLNQPIFPRFPMRRRLFGGDRYWW